MKLARLLLPLLLAAPVCAQGLILGAPAQGNAGGGTALTGLGTDNRIPRWDGTDTLQSSGVTLSDSDAMSGLASLTLGNGAAATPSLNFALDPTVGLYFVSNSMRFTHSGSERMRFNSNELELGPQHLGFGATLGSASVGLQYEDTGDLVITDGDPSDGANRLKLGAEGIDLGALLLIGGTAVDTSDTSLARIAAGVWQGSDAAGTGAGQFRTRGATAIHSSLSPATTEVGFHAYRDARAAIVLDSCNTNAADGSYINLRRTRGPASTPGVLSSGDVIAQLYFQGTTETTPANNTFAEIRATVDGTVGGSDAPGRLSFWTTADGQGTPTERLRIGQAGNTDLGTQQLVFGAGIASTTDVGIVRNAAGVLRVSDASTGTADLVTDDIILGAASTNGWRIDSNSATIIELNEGDGSEVDDGDLFRMANGTTTGRPAWIATDFSPSAPGHTFSGDTNTGYGSVEADAPAIAAEGSWRQIISNSVTLTDNTATTIVTIPLASGARCSGTIFLAYDVTDGTDHQQYSASHNFIAMDKAGTLTSNVGSGTTAAQATTGGTINAATTTILDGSNSISIQITFDTSLAGATITCHWQLVNLKHSTAGVLVTIP